MTRLRPTILAIVVAALFAAPLLLSASRLADARNRSQVAAASLARIVEDAKRVVALRAARQTVAERKRPEQDVIARVNTTLIEAGIRPDRFGGLRPESDAALAGAGAEVALRRQTLGITLRELSVPELGAFLERWATAQEIWTPGRIELSRVRNEAHEGRYDVALLIAATYITEP